MAKPKVKPPQRRSRKSKELYTIGIDLGGTKLAAALVNSRGDIVAQTVKPTVPPELAFLDPRRAKSEEQPTITAQDVRKHIVYVVNTIADTVMEILAAHPGYKVKGLGLASAGPMNLERGTLDYPSNFTGWKIVPLVKLVQQALAKRGRKLPVTFQNDAMAAALGEGWIGKAKDCSTYIMITVGTGIGTGVILRGLPAQSHGMGSEWGDLLVASPGLRHHPETVNSQSVEGIASGTGLVRRARERGLSFDSAHDIAEAAQGGNQQAMELFDEAAEALAALLYSLSMGFHPEKFVVSGGMLAIKDLFLPKTIALYRELIQRKNPQFLAPIQVAKLGTKAGVIGAARLPLIFDPL